MEFILRDVRGRDVQWRPIQLDFVFPERRDAAYVGTDDCRRPPVLMHHAVLGSPERFITVLLERRTG